MLICQQKYGTCCFCLDMPCLLRSPWIVHFYQSVNYVVVILQYLNCDSPNMQKFGLTICADEETLIRACQLFLEHSWHSEDLACLRIRVTLHHATLPEDHNKKRRKKTNFNDSQCFILNNYAQHITKPIKFPLDYWGWVHKYIQISSIIDIT